ncbi:MAG: hypothetical protein M0R73_11885 [Dehalococcoidia bacterium]|nr:hypothetical protein [Dehalococcoidia bacterium]
MRRTGALVRWVAAANLLAVAAAVAWSAPASGAGQAMRDFMAWCAIG